MRYSKLAWIILAPLIIGLIGLNSAAAQNSTTLVVWDSWTRQADQALIDQLDQQFEAAHPGVAVQRTAYRSADLAALLLDKLTQPDAPDVAIIDPAQMADLASADLLLPLDSYAAQYGWHSSAPATNEELEAANRVNGKLYGKAISAQAVGLFYNKAILGSLGLSVPTIWEDLDAALDTAKAAGYIPMTLGGLDDAALVNSFGALAYAYSDINDIHALLKRSPGAAFLTEGNLDGAQTFVDWIDAGYFSPNFASMDQDAALAEFTGGKSVFWLASSDNAAAILPTLGNNAVGFFLLPSPIGEPVTPTVGGFGAAYGIRATNARADLAAQYIDFLNSPDSAVTLLDNGILPVTPLDASRISTGTLSADLYNAWTTAEQADKIGQSLDRLLPQIGAQVQALASHQLAPEDFVNAVEQDYEAGMERTS